MGWAKIEAGKMRGVRRQLVCSGGIEDACAPVWVAC